MNSGWVHFQANRNIYILPSSQVSVDGNLLPYSNNARELGSSSTSWADVWAYEYYTRANNDRVKYTVWDSGTYGMGMLNGVSYGHIGGTGGGGSDYVTSFQMSNTANRGWWWCDSSHSNSQGAMSLTTEGKATIATSLSIGEGESVTSPSVTTLYVGGTATLNSSSDNQLLLTSPDTWTGIGFNDSAGTGTEYIWHRGSTNTFAIGGGGSTVSGKKLHIDGGTTIGSSYDGTSVPTDGLSVQGDVICNGNFYGKSVNGGYTAMYRIGAIFLTWDSDTYGTNFNHGIFSTNGSVDSYSDNITINSYGNIRMNIDSNSNGTNTFSIGQGTTGTGNTILNLTEGGDLTINGDINLGNNTAGLEAVSGGVVGVKLSGSFRAAVYYPESGSTYYADLNNTGDSIRVAGDVVAFYSSDIRYKENVKPIEKALDKVNKLRGVTFEWNEESHKPTGKKDIGVIAQEVEEVLPEIVQTRDNGYKAVDYQKLTALLIEAVKDQQKQINELKKLIK